LTIQGSSIGRATGCEIAASEGNLGVKTMNQNGVRYMVKVGELREA